MNLSYLTVLIYLSDCSVRCLDETGWIYLNRYKVAKKLKLVAVQEGIIKTLQFSNLQNFGTL